MRRRIPPNPVRAEPRTPKNVAVFVWLECQAMPSNAAEQLERSRAVREPASWGRGGTPLQEPNTQHAEPHSTTRERHGANGLPSHSLMSLDPAGAPPKVLRKQHGGNSALHASRALPERSGGFPEGDIGGIVPYTPAEPSQSVQRASFRVAFLGMFWTPGMVPGIALYNLT